MGLSAWPLSRYRRCRPASRTSTAPTSRSTRRCFDTCGWPSPSARTRSLTGRSPSTSASRIWRRLGSATALNASVVVAARATTKIIYRYGYISSRWLPTAQIALEPDRRRERQLFAPRRRHELDPGRQALRRAAAADRRGRPAGEAVGRGKARRVDLAGLVHRAVRQRRAREDGAQDEVVGRGEREHLRAVGVPTAEQGVELAGRSCRRRRSARRRSSARARRRGARPPRRRLPPRAAPPRRSPPRRSWPASASSSE